jgi:flagellar assembly protein FliH
VRAIRIFPSLSEFEHDLAIENASFPVLDQGQGDVAADEASQDLNLATAETIEADARREARRLLLSSRREAEAMVARARQAAEEVRAKARAEGLTAGRNEAAAEVRREAAPLIALLENLTKEFNACQQLYRGQMETQIPTLTVLLTKKVIQRELQLDRSTIVGIVRAALERVSGNRRELTLRLHPKDAEILISRRADLLEGLDKIEGIRFEGDPSITPGGCLVETANGLVDARLETQLEEATRILGGQGEP